MADTCRNCGQPVFLDYKGKTTELAWFHDDRRPDTESQCALYAEPK